jgi:hypothetical protein
VTVARVEVSIERATAAGRPAEITRSIGRRSGAPDVHPSALRRRGFKATLPNRSVDRGSPHAARSLLDLRLDQHGEMVERLPLHEEVTSKSRTVLLIMTINPDGSLAGSSTSGLRPRIGAKA